MTLRRLMVIGLAVLGSSCASGDPQEAIEGAAPGGGEGDASDVADLNQQALSLPGTLCAGPTGRSCPAGQYCRTIFPGRCPSKQLFGLCAPRPAVCPQIFAPVCGCDGQTYSNACVAASQGVAVASSGACTRRCTSNVDCAPASYCQKPAGQCGQAGVCTPRPEICPLILAPVCGCDGQTYGNACRAAGAGVNVAQPGRCPPPPPLRCRSNEDCASESYCQRKVGQCGEPGVCTERPQACPRIFRPVCGCDGQTYGNACEAAARGASVAREGACGPFCGGIAGIPCPGAGTCVDDPSDDCDPRTGGADCGGICRCSVDMTCAPGSRFDRSPSVCQCVPEQPNPCATVLCRAGTQCVVTNGQPTCVPPPGETCGATVCPAGQVCCNASCGICTPPGGACIQIVCDTKQ